MSDYKVIVYGATGAIGTSLIDIMSKKNPSWEIIAATRSGGKNSHLASLKLPNVKLVKGSIEDLESARRLTRDVNMVYCCVGFAEYEAKYWAKHWPIVVKNLLAVTSSARPLVFCDNLYAYGSSTNITTSSPTVTPSMTSKPGIRASLRKMFEERMRKSPKSIVVVGGADFFGAHSDGKTFLGETVVGNIVKGQKPLALGTADKIHDFCYTRDFAMAMYVVSTNSNVKETFGRFWICPHSIHNKTIKEVASMVYEIMGKNNQKPKFQVLPLFMMRVLGLGMTFMSEMKEMMPFWMNDYTVDDSEFYRAFGMKATPAEVGLRETIAYYQMKQKERK